MKKKKNKFSNQYIENVWNQLDDLLKVESDIEKINNHFCIYKIAQQV